MISVKIFCLSLLSVSWVSTVSAALTIDEVEGLQSFMHKLRKDGLASAYAAGHQQALDAYFLEYIHLFHQVLNPSPDTVRHGPNPAPRPSEELNHELDGLPNLVQLIRYSNLSIIHDLKLFLLPRDPGSVDENSIFGRVDDRSLTRVSADYGTEPTIPVTPWLGTETVYLAALLSLNNTMLRLVRPFDLQLMGATLVQRQRLVRYQDMITRLYNGMARYLQNRPLLPYYEAAREIQNELIQLANSSVSPARSSRIQTVTERLSHTILSMMAIYGLPARPEMPSKSTGRKRTTYTPAVPPAHGTAVISDLLAHRWEAGRLIDLGPAFKVSARVWLLQLLRGLKQDLQQFVDSLGVRSGWILPIPSLLDLAIPLLRKTPPAPRHSGTN
jgi:hypothetical protein